MPTRSVLQRLAPLATFPSIICPYMSATLNMANIPATADVLSSSTSSPFMDLPAELREMIYQYYYETSDKKQPPKKVRDKRWPSQWIHNKQARNFEILKPYFGVL
jgi:hypothetical protein